MDGACFAIIMAGCPPCASRADNQTISKPTISSHAALPKAHKQSANVGEKRRGREGGEDAKLLILLVELARIELATS